MPEADNYGRHRNHALIACTAWPILVALLAPGILEVLWLGFMLVLAAVLQFLWVPDAWAEWRTRYDRT